MRVQADGIRALDALQQLAALVRHHCEAAVGGIDMQPDALGLAEVGHRMERVDRAAAGGAGVGADRDGVETVRAVTMASTLADEPPLVSRPPAVSG